MIFSATSTSHRLHLLVPSRHTDTSLNLSYSIAFALRKLSDSTSVSCIHYHDLVAAVLPLIASPLLPYHNSLQQMFFDLALRAWGFILYVFSIQLQTCRISQCSVVLILMSTAPYYLLAIATIVL